MDQKYNETMEEVRNEASKDAVEEKESEMNEVSVENDTENDVIPDEEDLSEYKRQFLSRMRGKLVLSSILSLITAVLGIVLMIRVNDIVIGLCVVLFSVFILLISLYRYGFKKEDNIEVVRATCIDKRRSGYRKQNFEYTFEEENAKCFSVTTAQKEKFKKRIEYFLCFRKDKSGEVKHDGANLLDFMAVND